MSARSLLAAARRRRFPRLRFTDLRATVHARGSHYATFEVESLSAGGALIVGSFDLTSLERVRITLESASGRPIDVAARVLRIEPRSPGPSAFAVAFVDVPAHVEDRIQQLVLHELEIRRSSMTPMTLVVNADPAVQTRIERELATLGITAVVAATPLEMVWHLSDLAYRFADAIIDIDHTCESDLVGQVSELYPDVRCILLSKTEPERSEREVARRAFLPNPWTLQELEMLFHDRSGTKDARSIPGR